MAGSASEHVASGSVRHNSWQGGMLFGKPVGRICNIVNLFLSVCLGTSRNMDQTGSHIDDRLNFVAHRERPRNIREMPWLRGLSAGPDHGKNRKRRCEDKNPEENPQGPSRTARSWPNGMPLHLDFSASRVLAETSGVNPMDPLRNLHFLFDSPCSFSISSMCVQGFHAARS